eukprot:6204704-Pleurochrysis_carterae.AAC.1
MRGGGGRKRVAVQGHRGATCCVVRAPVQRGGPASASASAVRERTSGGEGPPPRQRLPFAAGAVQGRARAWPSACARMRRRGSTWPCSRRRAAARSSRARGAAARGARPPESEQGRVRTKSCTATQIVGVPPPSYE